MADLGLTHIAYVVGHLDESTAFYSKYARMEVLHSRSDSPGTRVAWISDRTRPFVLVLIEVPARLPARRMIGRTIRRLMPRFSHMGVACESRDEVDQLCAEAKREGILHAAPRELPPPVGYFGLIDDPDGYTLELSVGQEVEFSVRARATPE